MRCRTNMYPISIYKYRWIIMLVLVCFVSISVAASHFSSKSHFIEVITENVHGIELVCRLDEICVETVEINGIPMNVFTAPGLLSMTDVGAPALGSATRYIAIPQGARAQVVILDHEKEVHQDVEVAPVPEIPFDNENSPLRYEKDMSLYGHTMYFPSEPVMVSEPMQIRGVDVVIVNITPFRYYPAKKELVVYKHLHFRIDFIGGTGQFGEDRLRSRFWEPLLRGHLLNYESLPEIDLYAPERILARDGYEYIIIVPDDPVFEAWADTIKAWRTLQGISCEVFTLTEVGGSSASAIEDFIDEAYTTWDPAPVAFLLLSDYPSSGEQYGITSPIWDGYSVSDNIYSDVNGDDLPDLFHGRICAQTATQLSVMVNKFLSYERDPYTASDFYDAPLITGGWNSSSWLQISLEAIRGFFQYGLGKDPETQYSIISGSIYPGCPWSSAPYTEGIVQYFYVLGWLTDTLNPYNSTYWDNGSAVGINAAINSGAFFVQHRSVGAETSWQYPLYTMTDLSGLTNDMFTFVNSTNSLTGKYNWGNECFTEKFHRLNSGALGVNAAAEIGYSFVTDVYLWGMIDGMWPEFMPDYPGPRMTGYNDLRPSMAMTSGKYYLAQTTLPYTPQQKTNVYHLYHHHGDAFLTLYSEMPQNLYVVHDTVLLAGQTFFTVSANDSSVIALTVEGEIVGVAQGTGYAIDISIPPQSEGDTMIVTVTRANYYRYEADVPVVPVGIVENDDIKDIPRVVVVDEFVPNPFKHYVSISYTILNKMKTKLAVYDIQGTVITILQDDIMQPGWHTVTWNGEDDGGKPCPSGVYFIRMNIEEIQLIKKLVLLQ